MNIYLFFIEVIKFTLAGTGIVMVAFYLAKPYLENKEKLQLLELKKATSAQTLPLRLQAYERVVLLIDRINPSNLLVRLNASAYTAAELQSIISLPPDASGLDLGRAILAHLSKMEHDPYDVAVNMIKADLEELF
jgi:hypothetical protein